MILLIIANEIISVLDKLIIAMKICICLMHISFIDKSYIYEGSM